MLGNKHVFWQALLVALVVFWAGILIGVFFENSRFNTLQNYYFSSETEIFDFTLRNSILSSSDFDCDIAVAESIHFADRIYAEATDLEKYDAASRITDNIVELHKRYDLLRVMLWNDLINLKKKCGSELQDVNVVVYLYDYVDTDVHTKATQVTMGRVLLDLKKKYGDTVILIPIAEDTGVKSLDLLMNAYAIDTVPVVIINENSTIEGLFTVEEAEEHLSF